jgi:hypothetical protein
MKQLKQFLSILLNASILFAGLPMQTANAGIVGTESIVASQDAVALRERINRFLDRADVAAELVKQGVESTSAKARVDSLTDSELQRIAGKLDQAPAGGESILGVIFAVFIILLITDILGFTKVFPFTRSIR